MSDAIEKAAREAVEAAANSKQLELITAVLQAQQLLNAQQQAPVCQHQAAKPFDTKKWVVIGGVACVCSIAFALASVAIAIGACCATACLLVLRSMWRDFQKGK